MLLSSSLVDSPPRILESSGERYDYLYGLNGCYVLQRATGVTEVFSNKAINLSRVLYQNHYLQQYACWSLGATERIRYQRRGPYDWLVRILFTYILELNNTTAFITESNKTRYIFGCAMTLRWSLR